MSDPSIIRVVYHPSTGKQPIYMRNTRYQGAFLVGTECNAWGVALRQESCTQDAEIMIRRDRILEIQPLR